MYLTLKGPFYSLLPSANPFTVEAYNVLELRYYLIFSTSEFYSGTVIKIARDLDKSEAMEMRVSEVATAKLRSKSNTVFDYNCI